MSDDFDRALDERIRRVVCEALDRPAPTFVHQRSVEAICGVPRRAYLDLARSGAFPATKSGRLVLARTADVVAYVEAMLPRQRDAAHADDAEAAAFAKVHARRVK